MKSLQAQRDQILHQMAQLDTMEYGSLHAEHRPARSGGRHFGSRSLRDPAPPFFYITNRADLTVE